MKYRKKTKTKVGNEIYYKKKKVTLEQKMTKKKKKKKKKRRENKNQLTLSNNTAAQGCLCQFLFSSVFSPIWRENILVGSG